MKLQNPTIWSIVVGLFFGMGLTHWSQERAADARRHAPLLLSPDIPAARTRANGLPAYGSIAQDDTAVTTPDVQPPAMTANAQAIYILRGEELLELTHGSLIPRKSVKVSLTNGR